MSQIFNNKKQTVLRRLLRNNSPRAERILWGHLQRKNVIGFKFRRQYSVGRYVVDFCCPSARLVIEIDGDSHFGHEAEIYDTIRQEIISSLGFTVLRFQNEEIYQDLETVLMKIQQQLLAMTIRSLANYSCKL